MMMNPSPFDLVVSRLADVRPQPDGSIRAVCPTAAHNGNAGRNLTVRRGNKAVLLTCWSHQCTYQEIAEALGLEVCDLFDEPVTRYQYPDGRIVHKRHATKQFWQTGNKSGTALYNLDAVKHAVQQGDPVYLVEGEKDVENLRTIAGIVATCNAGGAGKAANSDWEPLRGATVRIIRDNDDPGRRHAAELVEILAPLADAVTLHEARTGKDASDHLAAHGDLTDLVSVDVPGDLSVVRLADVTAEEVRWLWPGRLPAGKLVTLDGDPGLGKSTLALTFAATITRGGIWPDGTRCDHPGDVILLSAEDGLADTIRPRLDAADADVRRVHAVQGVKLDDSGTLRPPTLADVDELERLVRRTHARLLVIDVLMAYLPGGTDSHKDSDIRRTLSRLAALADRAGCTVLLLRHLNKTKGNDPMYRGGGSIGIVGAARAGLLVAPNPDDDQTRVLAAVKSNLASLPDSLTYELVDDGCGVARVAWTGVSAHDARGLLADPDDTGQGERVEHAQHWLADYLEVHGESPSKDVKAAARREAGITERTLQRAVQRLRVTVVEEGFPRITKWALPCRATTPEPPPVSPKRGATGATGPDLRLVVGATGRKTQSRLDCETGATGPGTLSAEADPPESDGGDPAPFDPPTGDESGENHGYLPRTPGARPGVWIRARTPVTPPTTPAQIPQKPDALFADDEVDPDDTRDGDDDNT
ncbi:AAA family ATPase [Rhodococcus koreensis]|uniref:AAA family ATPase n=1 Tax=Rhodococcus koreensis TaxID=99653 RepID=UPI0036D98ABF